MSYKSAGNSRAPGSAAAENDDPGFWMNMNREAAVRHIQHLEQRARTWIIKLSCVLITPSKRPGRSQEARETLRMMMLISRLFFFFATESLFCSSGCSGPVSNTDPHRLNHFVFPKSLCCL